MAEKHKGSHPWAGAAARDQKLKHARQGKQTREHCCHWPGCYVQVVPAMWGCSRHWYMLPRHLRDAIWLAYQPGQEYCLEDAARGREVVRPSAAYLTAARAVQDWIAEHHPAPELPPAA